MTQRARIGFGTLLLLALASLTWGADESTVPAGHSVHGEAFNEGPRQLAYLMGGTGKVHLPVTTTNPTAQEFFNQGVGQLHGFWYFEAERSFRQVAALDPDCTMAYWGMAMANVNNAKRASGFIQKAVERKAKASRREQLWIEAYAKYWQEKKDEKERRRDLVRSLEDLSHEFPDELEAKAFLGFQIWENSRNGLPIPSQQAMDALFKEILAVEPMHPIHHHRTHLWDDAKAQRAVNSAARCGQSAPNIAHMWHMSGHTFSKLHRYADAAWQQEASARVDHRHMLHDRLLPDEIHNYAHNNQWLVENYEYIGRVHDAIALAKNLIELPRHPRYNTLDLKDDGSPYDKNNRGSSEGRRRLLEVLTRYELWDELIALSQTMYLEPTDLPAEQAKRLRALGAAYFSKGDTDKVRQQIQALEGVLQKVRTERVAAAERAEAEARQQKQPEEKVLKAMADALQKHADRLTLLEAALAELRGYVFLAQGDKAKAGASWEQAKDLPKERLARLWLLAGDTEKAQQLAREAVEAGTNQVHRLANYVDILQQGGQTAEAQEHFQRLRALSAEIDLEVPVMRRLAPVAQALGLPADWRVAKTVAPDVGQRPALEELGPVHWQPSPAPAWSLPDESGKSVALHDYRGRPVLVLFFLGSGCAHCLEQLNTFRPLVPEFAAAGISLVAISTDSPDGLKKTFAKSKLPSPCPLVSDHALKVFKAYRAFDDFEQVPLHGAFLVDGDGLVRWQDISYEPFTQTKFLLKEAKRLLQLPRPTAADRSAKPAGQ